MRAMTRLRGLALVRERCDNEDDASEGTDKGNGNAARVVGCDGAFMTKVHPRSGRGAAAVSGLCRSEFRAERVFSGAEPPL